MDHIQRLLPLFESQNVAQVKLNGSPLPMQYLGSKSRISKWTLEHIATRFQSSKVFYDLFAGTGAISAEAVKREFNLVANDVQPYSYAVLRALFLENRKGLKELANRLEEFDDNKELLSSGRRKAKDLLEKEFFFFENRKDINFDWREYKHFCENIPLLDLDGEIDRLRKQNEWNLFINYYANTYFGIRQCLQLDTIREFSESLSPRLKLLLIAATISVMTYAVSSTTHLAQFLKASSKITVQNLIKKRNINIIKEVSKRLCDLNHYPLPKFKATILNLDYIDALTAVDLDRDWIVYIDPPYFKEHYSRYYHVLDTFYLYDYPYLTFNKRINAVSRGRYRLERFTSDFGLKGKVESAFETIIKKCYQKKVRMAISYANTSLVSKDKLTRLAKQIGFNVYIEKTDLTHSGQGQPRHKKVLEYLFLLE